MKKQTKTKTLKRAIHPMTRGLKYLLMSKGVWDAYQARPPYQRNDYIGWIMRAELEGTRDKRTLQMLEELRQGDR